MNGLAICAGVGGLELGLRLADPEYQTVCYIEREVYPVADIITKMGEGHMDQAPIWDNVETFDGKPWRGKVDIVSAGFPCQPWSTANTKRKGVDDERWIWSDIERILCEVRSSLIFLENVPGLISDRGIEYVLGSLAFGGYDAVWNVFSASGVGANHKRRRVFILAYPAGCRLNKGGEYGPWRGEPNTAKGREDVENTRYRSRRDFRFIKKGDNSERGWSTYPSTVSGSSWWEIEPSVGRLADGVPDRVDRIRANGNAVVPLVAAYAYCYLTNVIINRLGGVK